MTVTASMVKELRERTGAGMMECKKALVEVDGDLDAAADNMRKAGLAKADKKSGRIAAEGRVVVEVSEDGRSAAIVEVNSETDFVSGGDDFANFAQSIAATVLANRPADLDALNSTVMTGGQSVEDARRALIAKVGENIQVRRFAIAESDDVLGSYSHGTRIGVLVCMKGGSEELARDVAMHVAASRPQYAVESEVPAEQVAHEKEILMDQARQEGKPEEIVEKMVVGRLKKFFAEITLVGQPFVKDPEITVAKLLKDNQAEVLSFLRFEVGEGIEKAADNFVEEVMAQVRGE
ncbi:MAG: translation elongation factor Ts [Chromatiales bacterium]|nr:translation elongation factor Ts [Chromatiales bacterium]